MNFPHPNTVEILAEIADYREAMVSSVFATAPAIRSLSQYAGATDDEARRRFVSAADEREAMKRLAAHAVARIEALDSRK